MSETIDNRIVEMGFDNKQFESGVKTSIDSLDKLKQSLNLEESARSLKNLEEASKSFSLAGIATGVDNISSKFSVLGVMGFTILQNLTNSAIDFGKKLVSSMTLSARQGMAEYETQMNAVQTIMANTASKGTTLTDVNAALDELNTYADKTIYNFSEMTKNIGTFTAAGVDLKTSTAAIKGIANLAAVSGSNAQQASTAMYQLSQALASGTVKLMDWNSVVNAGMGGQVFQDALKETARLHKVSIDSMIKQEGSFRETLSKGWLTSEILTETLAKFTGDLNAEQLKTMGYTEQQIAEILKLGKTASDAATKVKTFTQLKSTLQEAIQSGWAQTWRYVIGDFEQSKAFFTEVSDTLGALIQSSSDARNELIGNWSKMGGRALLIDALRNSFNYLMKVLQPIKEAFQEIFPPTTWKQLLYFTLEIDKFTKKLVFFEDQAAFLKSIFKGIFSIFDILRMGIVALAKAFLKLDTSMLPTGTNILEFLANIADYITNLRDAIKANDSFGVAIKKIGEWFVQAKIDVTAFVEAIKDKFSLLKVNFDEVKTWLSGIFKNVDTSGVDTFFSKIKIRFAPLETLFKILGTILGGMGKVIEKISPLFFKLSSAIADFIGKLAMSIANGVQNLDFSNLFDTINGGLIIALLVAIKNFINKGSNSLGKVGGVFDSLSGTLSGVKGILDGVRGSLEAWQQSLRAKVLLTIASAIGILTISLIALSMIDSAKLTTALVAVTTMFGQLMGSMAVYSKVAGNTGGAGFAAALIGLSVAVLLMSVAVANLARFSTKELAKGTSAITAMTILLVGFAKTMSKNTGDMVKSALGLTIFAVSLELLVSVVKRLGSLDLPTLVNGLIGVGVLLTELALFTRLSDMNKMGVGKGLGLLALSGAIVILSLAVEKFANMDKDKMVQGLEALGAVLVELGVFLQLSGDSKKVITTAIGMTILGAAMLIFAEAVTRMGNLSWEQIGKGLGTMAIALGIIATAINVMPKNMLLTGVSLVIIASSLVILANALTTMGQMSWEEIGRGLTALAGSMLVLATGMYAMQGALPGAAAMLIVAGALAIFAPTLQALGSMSLQEIGTGLLALAGVFTILGVAGYALTPVVPTLLGLAGAMLLIGLAAAAVGVGVLAFSAGLAALAVSGTAGAAAIVTMISMLLGIIPMVVKSLVDAIILFAQLIIEAAPVIGEALKVTLLSLIDVIMSVAPPLIEGLVTLLLQLIDAIITVIPKFLDAVFLLVNKILDLLVANVPKFVEKGYAIITAFLKGVRDNIGKVVTLAIEIVTNFIDAIAKKLPDLIDSGFKLIVSFINGMADGIDKNVPEINKAAGRLALAIIKGLADGIGSGVGTVAQAIGKLANGAINALKTLLQIFSPSHVFYGFGQDTGQGFVNGIVAMVEPVKKATDKFGNQVISGMNSTVSNIVDAINNNMDMNPTIRPVVDLSEVVSGGKKIDSILGEKSLNLSNTASKIAVVASRMPNSGNSSESQVNIPSGGSSITFNQNNYSPTALSRLDIYRQTKNQLVALKGLVPTT